MIIQRWQNLLLFIALILVCVFCAMPYAVIDSGLPRPEPVKVFACEAPVFLIVNICAAVMIAVALFCFRNLKRQMGLTIFAIVLMIASGVTCGFIVFNTMPEAQLVWDGGVVLLIAALLCCILAYRFMGKDKKTLESYDRLR